MSIIKGVIGIAFLVSIAYLFSSDKKKINWFQIIMGLGLQLVLALLILKVPFVEGVFDWFARAFTKVISFTNKGTEFLFKSFGTDKIESPLLNFAVIILPTVIFFSALTSLLYYWGILQKVVYAFAWVMKRLMKLSGAESLAAAGNIFLGQTESPLLVKPYLDKMTKSEIMSLMTGGMATIAGGVLAAYIGYLGGNNPEESARFAKHLLTASIMSAPAAIVAAKILVPEKEKFNEELKISNDRMGANALEAISNGTSEGLKLAVNVGAMLLVFTAFMAFGNYILFKAGDVTALNGVINENTPYDSLSFNMILGYLGAPIVWIIGVCQEDMLLVGQLLGEKTILNEFIAYKTLGEMKADSVFFEEKSVIMATYILCGFANFASIGIQIGGIGALVPTRKGLLSSLGFKALIGGTLACLFTAAIVGMFY